MSAFEIGQAVQIKDGARFGSKQQKKAFQAANWTGVIAANSRAIYKVRTPDKAHYDYFDADELTRVESEE